MAVIRLSRAQVLNASPIPKAELETKGPISASPPISELRRLEDMVQALFSSPVQILAAETLEGHVHHIRWIKLSSGHRLIVKASPRQRTSLLRRERYFLENEARVLALLEQYANPLIPRLYQYSPKGNHLGSSFLIREHMKGANLCEMEQLLTSKDRMEIDRQLGYLARVISQQVSSFFGPVNVVASGFGSKSWRRAFVSLFEEILRDAEDVFIHLPYADIRRQVARLGPHLDGVTQPALVIVNFGRPSQVIVDPESKQISGVIDLGSALWGDVLISEIFDDPSAALLDGFGLLSSDDPSQRIRCLLYVLHSFQPTFDPTVAL